MAGLLAVMLITLMSAAQAAPVRLLVFGDSLVAGYNLPPDAAYPVQLEKALKAKGLDVTVLNAGVSGDTTAAAAGRLDWALADRPTHVLVELGANDMLRGLAPEQARTNLDSILGKLKQAGLPTMLVGMLAAPNLGADYGKRFNGIYPDLAAKYGLPLYPFFLDGVAGDARLNLGDGLHPTREGVAIMVDRTLPHILRFLGQ
ncbi:MAG: arylesterase [Ferrovibrio sp.]|uniref:arylesterase n=1 Tax=Ferrovibrio sp. TaxID=1917215 RepID=UPI00261E104E|nr:arylesterase [Ferrovibrio sp.]MCW0235808.1 arylesterase [Ferrovibrio sp.]